MNNTVNSVNLHNNVMNAYDVDYGLGLPDHPTDLMELYNNHNNQQNPTTLPVELQYCFDHTQQAGGVSLDGFAPLSVENNNNNSGGISMNNVNMSNVNNMVGNMSMGLLNLDMPSFYPLDL